MIYFLKNTYLFESTMRHGGERMGSSICQFIWVSQRGSGTQALDPSFTYFLVVLAGSLSEVAIWKAGIIGGGFTHCTKAMPSPFDYVFRGLVSSMDFSGFCVLCILSFL